MIHTASHGSNPKGMQEERLNAFPQKHANPAPRFFVPYTKMSGDFAIVIEVVPPQGPDIVRLMTSLSPLEGVCFSRFSVASNPVAKPCLSALAVCAAIRQRLNKNSVLHCTTRDYNRLSLHSQLWGAKALGLHSVLIMTGDLVAPGNRTSTTTVRDVDVFGLVRMAREAGLYTGVVFGSGAPSSGLERAIRRLEEKTAAGAQYVVTQPIYDAEGAESLRKNLAHIAIPKIAGVLPLHSARHASFLHDRVSGIEVPEAVRDRMSSARDQMREGIDNAREVVAECRKNFDGVCLMPAFNRFETIREVLAP